MRVILVIFLTTVPILIGLALSFVAAYFQRIAAKAGQLPTLVFWLRFLFITQAAEIIWLLCVVQYVQWRMASLHLPRSTSIIPGWLYVIFAAILLVLSLFVFITPRIAARRINRQAQRGFPVQLNKP